MKGDFLQDTLKRITKRDLKKFTDQEFIHIPLSVTEIADFAFEECTKLKKVLIPARVKKIGRAPFPPGVKIIVDPCNEKFSADQYGNLFEKNTLIQSTYSDNTDTPIAITSAQYIGSFAFYYTNAPFLYFRKIPVYPGPKEGSFETQRKIIKKSKYYENKKNRPQFLPIIDPNSGHILLPESAAKIILPKAVKDSFKPDEDKEIYLKPKEYVEWLIFNGIDNTICEKEVPFFISNSAKNYGPLYCDTILNTLYGDENTPRLDVKFLFDQLYNIQLSLNEEIKFDNDRRMTLSNAQKLRSNRFIDILLQAPIHFITVKDSGTTVEIEDFFTGEQKYANIKNFTLPREDNNNPDCLAYYDGNNGNIFIWVDKIFLYENPHLIFQTVLLHEMIHLLLDIASRDRQRCKEYKDINSINEETIVNTLVILTYLNSKGCNDTYKKQVEAFVDKQPSVYRRALEFSKKPWREINEEILNCIKSKILCACLM